MYFVSVASFCKPAGRNPWRASSFARPSATQNATSSPAALVAKSVLGEAARETHLESVMGDLIFPDFHAKTRQYTKGGGIDDLVFLPIEDTSPCEMPPVQPIYQAPEQDPA